MVRKAVPFSHPTNPSGQTRRFLHPTQNLSFSRMLNCCWIYGRYTTLFRGRQALVCWNSRPTASMVLHEVACCRHPTLCALHRFLLIPLDPSLRLSLPPSSRPFHRCRFPFPSYTALAPHKAHRYRLRTTPASRRHIEARFTSPNLPFNIFEP